MPSSTISAQGAAMRNARQNSLEKRIAGLQRKLDQLQAANRRFTWRRLAAFILGAAATWYAAVNLDPLSARLTLLASGLLFATVVFFHRRLDARTARFEILKDLRSGQLARMRLDWEHIQPVPSYPANRERSPLDIDLDVTGPRSLHHLIDLSVSQEGSQRLADWLTQPNPDPEQIRRRQQIVQELGELPRFRDRLLLNLRLVSKEQLRGEKLLGWLSVDHPRSGRLRGMLVAAAALAAVNTALFLLNSFGKLPPYWLLSLTLYFAFYLYNSRLLGEFLDAVVELDKELGKFRALLVHLETFRYGKHEHLADLCTPFRDKKNPPSAQLKRIKMVTAGAGARMNPILGMLLNLILPWDFLFAYLASKLRRQAAQTLPGWLEVWYELEALCSLANFAYLNPDYNYPQITPAANPVFEAAGLGHPLIPAGRKVCNDIHIPALGEVNIITGSNMAGKSTFIKTVGINLCLAYAGGPVNAATLHSAPFRLCTCIHITDSITDGFSYFYAEVRCLKHLLGEMTKDDPRPLMYLIDEIFRGTNNRERLIGSRAYTRALIGAHGAGFIATHDLELAGLAAQSALVRNYHFRDFVQERTLAFDYKIHPGPSPTTNALKIMEMEGLPVETEQPPEKTV